MFKCVRCKLLAVFFGVSPVWKKNLKMLLYTAYTKKKNTRLMPFFFLLRDYIQQKKCTQCTAKEKICNLRCFGCVTYIRKQKVHTAYYAKKQK